MLSYDWQTFGDVIIVILLVATIVYCALLNRRLRALRGLDGDIRKLVSELSNAARGTQQGIATLKTYATTTGENLAAKTEAARSLADDLAFLTEKAGELAGRLEQGIGGARNLLKKPAAGEAEETLAIGAPTEAPPPRRGASRPLRPVETQLLDALKNLR